MYKIVKFIVLFIRDNVQYCLNMILFYEEINVRIYSG